MIQICPRRGLSIINEYLQLLVLVPASMSVPEKLRHQELPL